MNEQLKSAPPVLIQTFEHAHECVCQNCRTVYSLSGCFCSVGGTVFYKKGCPRCTGGKSR